jgi:hypothetical protein
MSSVPRRPAPSTDHAKIERYILLSNGWKRGYRTESPLFGVVGPRQDIMSLPIGDATVEQRLVALNVMEKYGITAAIRHSASLGNVEVIRVTDGLDKLIIARDMANTARWRQNTVAGPRGEDVPALNLFLSNTDRDALFTAAVMLKDLGVAAAPVRSKSLGDVFVLRVTGEENISRLKSVIHGLSDEPKPQAAPPKVPDYPSDTHVHSVSTDGIIVVRRRCDDGNGKVENPDGPAVVSPSGER